MDDGIVYHFDDVSDFYAELDDVLQQQSCDSAEVANEITRSYLSFLINFQNDFLNTSAEIAYVMYKFIDSPVYSQYHQSIIRHVLTTRAIKSSNISELSIIYSLLLYGGREDLGVMKCIVQTTINANGTNQFLQKLRNEIQYCVGGTRFTIAIMMLMFEMCKVAKLSKDDLDNISSPFIHYLLDIVENMVTDSDEMLNYAAMRLLLVFNEQFMMQRALNPVSEDGTELQNQIMRVLQSKIGSSHTFSENLIFMLNRADDACVQMLILKLLYLIFTTEELYEFFYTNDLCVLVDIVLRELCDLGDENDAEALRQTYLRVLNPMLVNTQLRYTPYKHKQIHRTLCAMIAPRAYRPVNATTHRLVQRIMEDWWAGICEEPVAPVVGVHLDNIKIGPDNVAVAIAAETASPAPSPIVSATTAADTAILADNTTQSTVAGITCPKSIDKGDTDRGVLCA
ncbi:pre-rRNA processing [Umbelopsis nana]